MDSQVKTIEGICAAANGTPDPCPFSSVVTRLHMGLCTAGSDWDRHQRAGQPLQTLVPKGLASFVLWVCQFLGKGNAQKAEEAFSYARGEYDFTLLTDYEEMLAEAHLYVAFAWGEDRDRHKGSENRLFYLVSALAVIFLFCEEHEVDLWGAIHAEQQSGTPRRSDLPANYSP